MVAATLQAARAMSAPSATLRLQGLVRQREILGSAFYPCWNTLQKTGSADALETWAEAVLELANVNAGPAALLIFWRISHDEAGSKNASALAQSAHAASDICRSAGAQATRMALEARLQLSAIFSQKSVAQETIWWRAVLHLAQEAPTCVTALLPHAVSIIRDIGAHGFESFISAGLRATATKPKERLAFFKLEDPRARLALDRLGGQVTFSQLRQRMQAFAAALWGTSPPMAPGLLQADGSPMRRASIAGGKLLMPEAFRGVPQSAATTLYYAAVAHATAHLALGTGRFAVGTLKPLQLVLIGLVEDARIEALAMRRFPGLRRLWAPFHVATPYGTTVPSLLARLSRALFDPEYADGDGFVMKGKALFEEMKDLEDPALSRRIGGLLGNDLGQMRVQFNAKTYCIEPPYRDDGLGLWNFPQSPDAPQTSSDLHIETARSLPGQTNNQMQPEPGLEKAAGRARLVSQEDRGVPIATYPEWDHAAQIERADWTTVRDVAAIPGDAATIDDQLQRETGLRVRLQRLVRNAKLGRLIRLRRQPDGTDFDLDAVVDAAISLRLGDMPDDRLHRMNVPQSRDVSIMVLADTSESTRDAVPAASTDILSIEKLAVATLASAMSSLGDKFALRAFASRGRDDVQFVRVKDFDEPFDEAAKARLAGLRPGFSTRLGAALRHAGTELAGVKATRKILLVLTDGAPADIDVTNPLDLVEDARRAALSLRGLGIDVFGIVLDPAGHGAGTAVFGRRNCMPVRRIEELPSRLSEIYFRIERR